MFDPSAVVSVNRNRARFAFGAFAHGVLSKNALNFQALRDVFPRWKKIPDFSVLREGRFREKHEIVAKFLPFFRHVRAYDSLYELFGARDSFILLIPQRGCNSRREKCGWRKSFTTTTTTTTTTTITPATILIPGRVYVLDDKCGQIQRYGGMDRRRGRFDRSRVLIHERNKRVRLNHR